FAAATVVTLAAAVAAAKQCAGSSVARPPPGSRRRRRSWTGGFAWRAASHRPGRWRQPSIPVREPTGGVIPRFAEAPENVCAAKRSSKPGAESPLLTGGCCHSPLQRRSPRTSPRCDVAVVSHVLLGIVDRRTSSRLRRRALGGARGFGVDLGTPLRQPGTRGHLPLLDVAPQRDQQPAGQSHHS